MNLGTAFVKLNNVNVEKIERVGFGVFKRKSIRLIFRLFDLYFIGWISGNVFYGDKDEFDKNNNLLDSKITTALAATCIRTIKSIGFSFKYDRLPMETVTTQWKHITKLLTSKETDDVKQGVSSIAVLTSESWRFFPIKNACSKCKYSVNLHDSVSEHVLGLSVEKKDLKCYTLRDLVNDWSKFSEGVNTPVIDSDIRKILRMAAIEKEQKHHDIANSI